MFPSILKKIHDLSFSRKLFLSTFLGIATTAAMQPWNFFPVIWITIPLLIITIDSIQTKIRSFLIGWFFGLGYFGSSFSWITNAFYVNEEMYGSIAIPSVFLLSSGFAIYIGLLGLMLAFYPRNSINEKEENAHLNNSSRICWYKVTFFSSMWAIIEWFRGWFLTGFPWNPIGNIWSNYLYVSQSVSIFGVYGLSLITILSASSVYILFNRNTHHSKALLIIICNLPLILITIWGTHRVVSTNVSYLKKIELKLIQPNISQKDKWVKKLRRGHLEKLLKMSKQENKNNTHIVWPEVAITYPINKNIIDFIYPSIPENGKLITGSRRIETTLYGNKNYNSLYIITKNKKIESIYDKVKLVPFGEFMPFGAFIDLNNSTNINGFNPGERRNIIHSENLPPFIPAICYEIIFSGYLYNKNMQPDWILNITNDAWFGNSSGPYQHFAASRMRAIEHGLPLVRVANSGITAVVDGYGRILNKIDLGEEGIINTAIPTKLSKTLFTEFGHSLFLFVSIFFVINSLGIFKYNKLKI